MLQEQILLASGDGEQRRVVAIVVHGEVFRILQRHVSRGLRSRAVGLWRAAGRKQQAQRKRRDQNAPFHEAASMLSDAKQSAYAISCGSLMATVSATTAIGRSNTVTGI